MKRKVGEIFKIGRGFYHVVEETCACRGCDLIGDLCQKVKSIRGECLPANRKGDGVIFVKIKDMEERTIKLTLEKAREFYEKGDEFRDLALSAFTKEELTRKELPKTWEEFCDNSFISYSEHYITPYGGVQGNSCTGDKRDSRKKNLLPNREEAYKHLALMQLHQLRDCYRQGWMPVFGKTNSSIVRNKDGELKIFDYEQFSTFLAFPDKETASSFLNNFRDIIEQAGDLI